MGKAGALTVTGCDVQSSRFHGTSTTRVTPHTSTLTTSPSTSASQRPSLAPHPPSGLYSTPPPCLPCSGEWRGGATDESTSTMLDFEKPPGDLKLPREVEWLLSLVQAQWVASSKCRLASARFKHVSHPGSPILKTVRILRTVLKYRQSLSIDSFLKDSPFLRQSAFLR